VVSACGFSSVPEQRAVRVGPCVPGEVPFRASGPIPYRGPGCSGRSRPSLGVWPFSPGRSGPVGQGAIATGKGDGPMNAVWPCAKMPGRWRGQRVFLSPALRQTCSPRAGTTVLRHFGMPREDRLALAWTRTRTDGVAREQPCGTPGGSGTCRRVPSPMIGGHPWLWEWRYPSGSLLLRPSAIGSRAHHCVLGAGLRFRKVPARRGRSGRSFRPESMGCPCFGPWLR